MWKVGGNDITGKFCLTFGWSLELSIDTLLRKTYLFGSLRASRDRLGGLIVYLS